MNLLITGAWADAKSHFHEIEAMGHTIAFLQREGDPLPCDPAWVEGVVCNGLFLHHPIQDFPNLRLLQLTSAGCDRVDLEYVRARGIGLRTARGVYSIPMAEFALCGVLQLYKQSGFFYENQKTHRWEKHRGLLELWGKAVSIVGCGSVGTECARRFTALGCRVTGLDLVSGENPAFERILPMAELEGVLAKTDILILCVPLTGETRHLMDRRRIGLLPNSAVLVNISRGAVLEEAALPEALEQGRLLGAVLDVFEQEPLPQDHPLWDVPNLLVTPHNSFVGEANGPRLSRVILDTLGSQACP